MNIPGSNLLNTALRLIQYQSVEYYRYLGRVQNDIGQYINTYDLPISVKGSFQAVPRNLYAQYELDLSKDYATFYTSDNILSLDRDRTGDYILYASKRWKCESPNDWRAMDGWRGILLSYQDEPL